MKSMQQTARGDWIGPDRRHYWGTYRPMPAVIHSLCEGIGICGGTVFLVVMTGLALGGLAGIVYLILF